MDMAAWPRRGRRVAGPVRREQIRLLWLNAPSNPTGEVLDVDQLAALLAWARERGIVVASDECYALLPWTVDEVPSILDPRVNGGSLEGLLCVYSLSKQSNLAGYRAAFVAGDPSVVGELLAVRKQAGMMLPAPIQAAMTVALGDDDAVATQRETYRARRAILEPALRGAGGAIHGSQAGLYLWTTFDEDAMSSVDRLAASGSWSLPGCSMVRVAGVSSASRSPRPMSGSPPPPSASSAPDTCASRAPTDPTLHNGEPMDHATSAQLTLGEKSLDLPIVPSVEGNSGISIGPLRKETGAVTYDPGFMNTANAKSSITYIDGDEGILRYRGYPIEQLAEKSSDLEVSYLLINGELPTRGQLDNFEAQVEHRTLLDVRFKRMFESFPRDAHPMAVLQAGTSALSTFYQDSLDPFDEEQVRSPRCDCWRRCRPWPPTRTGSRRAMHCCTRTTGSR